MTALQRGLRALHLHSVGRGVGTGSWGGVGARRGRGLRQRVGFCGGCTFVTTLQRGLRALSGLSRVGGYPPPTDPDQGRAVERRNRGGGDGGVGVGRSRALSGPSVGRGCWTAVPVHAMRREGGGRGRKGRGVGAERRGAYAKTGEGEGGLLGPSGAGSWGGGASGRTDSVPLRLALMIHGPMYHQLRSSMYRPTHGPMYHQLRSSMYRPLHRPMYHPRLCPMYHPTHVFMYQQSKHTTCILSPPHPNRAPTASLTRASFSVCPPAFAFLPHPTRAPTAPPRTHPRAVSTPLPFPKGGSREGFWNDPPQRPSLPHRSSVVPQPLPWPGFLGAWKAPKSGECREGRPPSLQRCLEEKPIPKQSPRHRRRPLSGRKPHPTSKKKANPIRKPHP